MNLRQLALMEPAAEAVEAGMSAGSETATAIQDYLQAIRCEQPASREQQEAIARREERRQAYLDARQRVADYNGKSQNELNRRIDRLKLAWTEFLEADHWSKYWGYIPFRSEAEQLRILLELKMVSYDSNTVGPIYDGIQYRVDRVPVDMGPTTIGGKARPLTYLRVFRPV